MKHPWCRKESRPDSPAPALPAPAPAHGLLDKAAVAAVEQVPNQNARAEYLGGEGYGHQLMNSVGIFNMNWGVYTFYWKLARFWGFQILDVDVGMSCANFGYICWPWDALMFLHNLFWDWQWIPAFLKTRKTQHSRGCVGLKARCSICQSSPGDVVGLYIDSKHWAWGSVALSCKLFPRI